MRRLLPSLCLLAVTMTAGRSFAVAPLDPQFEGVDVDNKLGEKVPADVPFTSTTEATTSLGAFLDGDGPDGRPVLLTLNYFRCTSLCSQQLNSLLLTLTSLGWAPGPEKFRIVTVSFDPTDTVEIARGKQDTYRIELARGLAEKAGEELDEAALAERAKAIDWTFLVGDDRSVRTLTKGLGYYFRFDEASRQYAHSPVVYVLSPKGIITRYLWGLWPTPEAGDEAQETISARDLKFALMEASSGVLGTFGDKVLLSCFVFENGKYHGFAWGFMRIGASLVALVLGLWLFVWWRRDRRRRLPASLNDQAAVARGQGV